MYRSPAGFAALALACGAFALAGCAGLPPKTALRPIKPADSYRADRTLAAPMADWPTQAWWSRYGDPQLDRLEAEALAGSPTLAQAEARLEKARSDARAAGAALYPSLSGNGTAEEVKQSYNTGIPPQFVPHGWNDFGQATLNFSWEIDFWGKNRAAVAAATSEARASEADEAEARLMLTTNVASAYATLAQLYADRDLTAEAVRVRQQTAKLVQARVSNGVDTQAELKQAQAGPPAQLSDLAALDEQIATTRNALAALVGAGPDRGLEIDRPATPQLKGFGLPASLPAELIGRRPDVVAARWRVEARTRSVDVAKRSFYPNINLTGYYGQQALHLSNFFAAGSNFGAIGPAITLPILDGGRLRANLRGAGADRDEAVGVYDAALTQALHDVADALASERSLAERLAQSQAALAADEGAYRVALLRYQGGLAPYQNVLLVEDAVINQRRVVSDLQSRAFALDVVLVRALGGGYVDARVKEKPRA